MLSLLSRWMSRWSLASLHRLGGLLGWATYQLSPTYRRRFDAAVAQVFHHPVHRLRMGRVRSGIE